VKWLSEQIDCLQIPTVDLYALTLERHLRMHAIESPDEAFRLLCRLHADHSRWLVMQDRMPESAMVSRQALALMTEPNRCEKHWLTALNIAAIHVGTGQRGERTSLKLLGSWLPKVTQPQYRSILVCDISLYAARCGRLDQAESALQQARDLVDQVDDFGVSAELERYYRLTRMQVLTLAGRPIEALSCLPSMPPTRSHRVFIHLVIAQTLVAAGDKNGAQNHLAQAQIILDETPAVRYQQILNATSGLI